MKRFLILVMVSLATVTLYAKKVEYKVVMSEVVPSGYEKDVFKKVIVVMTEARLYLQKKYKKKVSFEYSKSLVKNKKDILSMLDKTKGRFYLYLEIDKKKTNKNLEKVFYNLVIFDKHSKKSKTVKTKALIRDKKIVQISAGNMKSSSKKIAKILKKR